MKIPDVDDIMRPFMESPAEGLPEEAVVNDTFVLPYQRVLAPYLRVVSQPALRIVRGLILRPQEKTNAELWLAIERLTARLDRLERDKSGSRSES